MSETNGRGVDLVLNSLAEEKLQASVRCLALGGRFLEIGKFDINNNSRLGRLYFINLFHFYWYNVIWFCLELQQEKMLLVLWLSYSQYSDYTVSWLIKVWFPGKGEKKFSLLLNIQIHSGTHPAYYSIHTGGCYCWSKVARA